MYNCMRKYYPLRLIKVADLRPDKNYILACFPHGVIAQGCIVNLATNLNKVTELFPDIDIRVTIMNIFLYLPIVREYFMAIG